MNELYDDSAADAYCVGDVPLEHVDADDLQHVQERIDEAQALPEGDERSWAVLGLLSDLYGDDLVIL